LISTKQLSDFTSQGSKFLFERLKIKDSFLSKEPEMWLENEDFKAVVAVIRGLRFINDIVERGVALIQTFNTKITNLE
jgi:hypothetical protein